VATRHGYATSSHTYQGVNSHESGNAHWHDVLQSNYGNQQGKHDDQKLATLLDDFKVALETNAGKECKHKYILQCAIERHLDIAPTI